MNVTNRSNRNKIAAGIAALAGVAALAALPVTQAMAQFGGPPPYGGPAPFGYQGRRPFQGGRPQVIPWSFASSRPSLPNGRATGLFIWHDRNTVHVESTDNHWFGDDINGFIEIEGGSFDNVQNTHDKADTRYRVMGKNRIAFHFNAKDREVDGFKFNIHDGKRLIFHIGMNGNRTGSVYYGESMTPSGEDPVAFNLKK